MTLFVGEIKVNKNDSKHSDNLSIGKNYAQKIIHKNLVCFKLYIPNWSWTGKIYNFLKKSFKLILYYDKNTSLWQENTIIVLI